MLANLTMNRAEFVQMVGTQLLMMGIMAVNDRSNAGVPHNFAPLFVGFVVMVIGMSFGMNSGYAINPARDFGPRLFTAVAGWGTEVFTLVVSSYPAPIDEYVSKPGLASSRTQDKSESPVRPFTVHI